MRPLQSRNAMSCLALAATTTLLSTGCQIGPGALKVANAHYSDAVRISSSEQILVNLVRLRYRDQPVFLAVSNISTQFELGTSGAINGTLNEGAGDVLGLGAGVNYSERPTISFSIMGGEEFQKRMLAPLNVGVVALLAESGWRTDRVFRLTVEKINGLDNAPKASGPTPSTAPEYQRFLEAVTLLHALASKDLIDAEYETRREMISDPIPIDQIEAADLVDAAKSGVEFEVDETSQTVGLFFESRRLVLRFSDEAERSPDIARLRELLHLDPTRRRVDVVSLEDSAFDPFQPQRPMSELGIDTRSLMGVLYFLSHAVQPPAEHLDAGIVTNTLDAAGSPFDWNDVLDGLFTIHSSADRPRNASVAVRHRATWFYIDDADETSKSTFLLLSQLFTLQAGNIEEVKPVLTLPVGG